MVNSRSDTLKIGKKTETELSYELSNKIEKSFQLWIETNIRRMHRECKTDPVESVNCQDLSVIIKKLYLL